MDLTEVIATVEKDFPEAATALTEHQTAFNATMTKMGGLEVDLQTAAEKRDRLKTTIRNATGLEEITEEALKTVLAGNSANTEIYTKEIDQLRGKLGESANAVDAVSAKYESQIFGLKLDRSVTSLGAMDEVHSQHAYKTVVEELARNAEFDDEGNIMYRNTDGTTIYNGANPMTIQAKYELIKADDTYSYLFKPQFKSGGGKAPNGASGPKQDSGGATLRRSKMDDNAKVKYIAKFSLDAYKNLPY